jgi:hypothetical protein
MSLKLKVGSLFRHFLSLAFYVVSYLLTCLVNQHQSTSFDYSMNHMRHHSLGLKGISMAALQSLSPQQFAQLPVEQLQLFTKDHMQGGV